MRVEEFDFPPILKEFGGERKHNYLNNFILIFFVQQSYIKFK